MTRPTVAPFFRAPVHVSIEARDLWARDLSDETFARVLAQCPTSLRVNVERLFAAATLAARLDTGLLLVEGWRGNTIDAVGGQRYRPGSSMGDLLLRMLARRELVRLPGRPERRSISRCTVAEARALGEIAGGRLIGIAGGSHPSVRRARRCLRVVAPDATVLSPRTALVRAGLRPTRAQAALLAATALGPWELARDLVVEAGSWGLHGLTVIERWARSPRTPLEERIAERIRRDHA